MIDRLHSIFSRIRSFFTTRKLDDDFAQELESHLDLLAAENIRRGMSAEEARRAARLKLGSEPALRETHHDQRTIRWLESFAQDLRFAFRMLRKNPVFAIAAIATMAIGIGANTAIFSVLNATLFFSLPYPQPNRITFVATFSPGFAKFTQTSRPIVVDATYNSWEKRNHSFSAMAAYDASDQATLTGGGEPERLHVVDVTPGFFQVLGVEPVLGRTFHNSEGGPGEPATAILTDRLWRSRFSASPDVIGQSIKLNDQLYTVVGVMPKGFQFPEATTPDPDVLLPLDTSKASITDQSTRMLQSSLGRLKAGISRAEAQADLQVISQQDLKQAQGFFQAFLSGSHVELVPLRDRLVGNTRPALLVLWGAVGFLLLIACVNVANLVLARATAREREIAVRIALGAHRWRIARQLITENLIIAFFGAGAGLAIAYGVVQLARVWGASDLPRLGNAKIDLPVLAFTALLAASAGLLAGLGPARIAWRFSANGLKEGSHASTGRSHLRLRSVLMTAEIAMALVLVIGSGLLVRSFLQITGIDLGFNSEHVLTAELAVPRVKYSQAQQRYFVDSLLERIRSLPQVASAAAAEEIPMSGVQATSNFQIDGQSVLGPSLPPRAHFDTISPGYFSAMGIPIVAGRDFEPSDGASTGRVIVVNQALVRRYFPLGDALEHELALGPDKYRIIGIVGDIRQGGLLNEPMPTIFRDYAWSPFPIVCVVVRSAGNPNSVAPELRAEVQSIDKEVPIFNVATMDDRLSQMEAAHRFDTVALGVFALVGLLLAAIGAYGVIAYSVAERTHEIGIRMALGASDSSVLRMVIEKTLALALIGIVIGVGGALALTRYLQSLLYHVGPDDPSTFVLASVILILTAVMAGYLPARRAMRVDPMEALRHE